MCGILVIHDPGDEIDRLLIRDALESISSRGPDSSGMERIGPVTMGHRRLILIDPEGGVQPMRGGAGTPAEGLTIVFNGTIFNHDELRPSLDYPFITRSDTEVLLALLAGEGIPGLARARGEYAFVLHDSKNGRITAVRDRFGTKPLFYAARGGALVIASTPGAIIRTGIIEPEPDLETIDLYLSFRNYPQEMTFFRGIRGIPPGGILVHDGKDLSIGGLPPLPFRGTDPPDDTGLRRAFEMAVSRRLVADVPVGAFLSGGIDSTSIVAAAARGRGLDTFTIGIGEGDEREAARRTSDLLGTRHHEQLVEDSAVMKRLPFIVEAVGSPRMGHSELNDAAMTLAKRSVTSVLTGTGGDELFGGYIPHYGEGDPVLRQAGRFRIVFRPEAKAGIFRGDLLETAGIDGGSDRAEETIRSSISGAAKRHGATSPLDIAMAFHLDFYLPGLLLLDEALGASRSLDVRTPFLDDDLARLALSLPEDDRFDGTLGKVALRRALAGLIPDHVANDPVKRGFGVRSGWLGGRTLEWIESLFIEPVSGDLIEPGAVRRIIADHREGRRIFSRRIWTLANLEIWMRIYLEGIRPEEIAS